ncbi:MAG: hypothetical protein KF893_26625 [Caldilineaceae bacterium]|nr:hypothetical protein [Caldilineaceae bacterium]
MQGVHIGRFVGVYPPAQILEPALAELDPSSGLAAGLHNLQNYLAHLHVELASLSLELWLGLERQSFTRFSLLTPAVPFIEADGQIRWLESGQDMGWPSAQLTPDTCLWLQEYTLNTILKWEADGLNGEPLFAIDLAGIQRELAVVIGIGDKRGKVTSSQSPVPSPQSPISNHSSKRRSANVSRAERRFFTNAE